MKVRTSKPCSIRPWYQSTKRYGGAVFGCLGGPVVRWKEMRTWRGIWKRKWNHQQRNYTKAQSTSAKLQPWATTQNPHAHNLIHAIVTPDHNRSHPRAHDKKATARQSFRKILAHAPLEQSVSSGLDSNADRNITQRREYHSARKASGAASKPHRQKKRPANHLLLEASVCPGVS